MKLLLAAKADVNAGLKTYGMTPLHVAAWQGHTTVARLLLDAKADLHAKTHIDGIEDTPLSFAKQAGHSEIVKLLKEHGAIE